MDTLSHLILEIEQLKMDQQYKTAIDILEKSIIKYQDDYRLYEELADIYLYMWELSKGLRSVNFALKLNKKSATGHYLKGFILLSQDKVTPAIKHLEQSNKLLGNNSEVLRNLGWAYTMVGQSERGITILKRALAMAPEDELITEDLAMALIGIGDIGEGNQLLQRIGKKIIG